MICAEEGCKCLRLFLPCGSTGCAHLMSAPSKLFALEKEVSDKQKHSGRQAIDKLMPLCGQRLKQLAGAC